MKQRCIKLKNGYTFMMRTTVTYKPHLLTHKRTIWINKRFFNNHHCTIKEISLYFLQFYEVYCQMGTKFLMEDYKNSVLLDREQSSKVIKNLSKVVIKQKPSRLSLLESYHKPPCSTSLHSHVANEHIIHSFTIMNGRW